ncbi:MAG TPA: zinc-binding alcohol dehydrogenase [Anaerolineales bacterium]|nr:zinc-binding alcohol dehydrogenase [Anaerolineales bacterium]
MADSLRAESLWFTAPRQVEIRAATLAPPGPGEVLVRTKLSAISAGTELLIYRGQAPSDLPADDTLPALSGMLALPLRYGYAAVGRVVGLGEGVPPEYLNRRVMAFQPHATHFTARVEQVVSLPEAISDEEAAFLPNLETAVNLVLDGAPRIGEQVAILGQGVVGLLTTALLSRMPLASLATAEAFPRRREASIAMGAHACLDPAAENFASELALRLQAQRPYPGADLTYELSGDPTALDLAVAITGRNGRIVIGSWYGTKRAPIHLGGRFHRSRIRMISSQVSSLAPELSGAWTTTRRLEVALSLLPGLPVRNLVTHRLPFHQSSDAYRILDESPAEALQVLLTYSA